VYKELKKFSYLCIGLAGLHGSKTHFSQHCSRPAKTCNRTVGCYFCINQRKLVVSGCHQLLLLKLELSSCISVIQLKHQSFLHIITAQSLLNSGYTCFERHVLLCSSFGDLERTRAEHAFFYMADSCFMHNINHVIHCCFFHFVSTHLVCHARGLCKCVVVF
jgi:hypothetical protein